jgi:glycerol-3-phosphate dehydrogenase
LRAALRCEPTAAESRSYDILVVGGGVQGAMLALEAGRRGLRCLVVERGDFGCGASRASLGILHGGLRYLQSLDLARAQRSAVEQAWFQDQFPKLVAPLPCLMPLYGGLRRPVLFRAALVAHERLTRGAVLPAGRVLSRAETVRLSPLVDREELLGAGLWYELRMPSPEHVALETLRRACALGATVLDHIEATAPLLSGGRMTGVAARDRTTGRPLRFEAGIVIEATGPGPAHIGPATAALPAVLAFNVLLRSGQVEGTALGTRADPANGRSYFLVPWKGMLLVGTGYLPWRPGQPVFPSTEELEAFLAVIRRLVARSELLEGEILGIWAGLLPEGRPGEPAIADRVLQGEGDRCPPGYARVCGAKFTTARALADQVLTKLVPGRPVVRDWQDAATDVHTEILH